MTTITTRSSVLAAVVESTEGTPVKPSAAAEFLPIEDDVSMEPAFESLENAELKNSLGPAKPIVGSESPTSSFSLYLKHSGTEGDAPNYGSSLLKALFGAEDDAGVEHDLVAGSTTAVLNVDSGEGATYMRGQAVMIKASGGYEIRPVHSIATDALTLGFEMAGSAPAATTLLGEAITYYPTNTGTPQTLSIWHYAGNGGAIQMMAGSRVVSYSMSVEAGQLINQEFSLEGVGYYFDPIETTSSDYNLDFTSDNGTYAVTVEAKTWKDPHELADAIASAMNAADTAETFACIYSDSTGKFTISTSTSTVLSLLWKTGTSGSDNTDEHIGTLLGFDDSADDTGSTSYIAGSAQDFSNPVGSVSFDDADPLAAKANRLMIGDDASDNLCVDASSFSINIDTPKTDINSICAASGKSGSVINARTVTVSVTALLNQYDADKFRKLRENTETRLCYVAGEKSGGNWVPGKCLCWYLPTTTISSLTPIEDQDGLVGFTAEFTAFVDDEGNGEVYLSFV